MLIKDKISSPLSYSTILSIFKSPVNIPKQLIKHLCTKLYNFDSNLKSLNTLPNKSNFLAKGQEFKKRPFYLDSLSTSKVDPRVLDSMLPYMGGLFGNSSSRTHLFGWETEKAVDNAREQIGSLLNCRPKDVIFTSGATESDNLAIKGYAQFLEESGANPEECELITLPTEHKAVLDVFRSLEEKGFKVKYLKPNPDGGLDLEYFRKALNKNTKFVSIMHVNNEIGTISDIRQIGEIIQDFNRTQSPDSRIIFHSDAAQSFGKIPIDIKEWGVDLLSISGHKIYGPKGVGALILNSAPPVGRRVRLKALQLGGGHERGIRSGTMATGLIVGLGKAAALAKENMSRDHAYVEKLSRRLKDGLMKDIGVYFNGSKEHHYPGCNNFSFDYVEGESLMIGLKDLALSSGSACTSSSLEPSYVLKALGIGDELAHTSIRYGISKFTTEEEIDRAIKQTNEWVAKLREVSPLYEMVKEGIDLKSIEWAE